MRALAPARLSPAKSSGPPVAAARGDSPPPEPSYSLSALSPEMVLSRSLSPPPPPAAAAESYASPTVLKGTAIGLFWGLVLGLVVALIGSCVCLSCCWWRRWRRRVSAGAPGGSKDDPEALCPGMYVFTYKELETATNGFSDSSLLGQGGFGYVHRGVLPDGKEVAVKQLKVGSAQGEREFRAEVDIISRVHHKHLVSLVGYCSAGDDMMLVYEFLPNKTLDFHLHGNSGTHLSWDSRMKIIQGFAQGLAYLHEDCQPRIIHRDIKATNILLDFEFEAKVSDFGLAKILDADTHVTTRVMGTVGYLAPEYATSGKYSHKSDIFSFGVVLLELLTGRHPVDSTIPTSSSISGPKKSTSNNMVDWARPLLVKALETREFDELVDPRLQKIYDPVEVARVVVCAMLCVSHCAKKRPKMGEVVRALEGNLSLEHLCSSSMLEQDNSGESSYDSGQYEDDLEKFRKLAFGGLEHGSFSGTSGLTSENGQDRSISPFGRQEPGPR